MRNETISNHNDTPTPPIASLSKKDFAKRHSSSPRTVDNWVAFGCPVLRVSSRKLLFPIADCDAWLRERFLVARRKPSHTAASRSQRIAPTTEGQTEGTV